ncbi:MAG: phage virion morphogenesis protein [Candidatus Sungbacteria bacterium]|nr:phage virion morphogenesis protein [Flavobacteriaceae bacterium]MDZ4147861.1 phage virion morphogenesis protein [Flavobacteriaceae bacterium]MDZ4286007.1 phage virion morphogenesis protein [Candidatus Sungbacteria bacterium]
MPLSPDYISKLNRLQLLYRKFPQLAGIEAVNFSKERFRQKNWLDRTREKWEPRKRIGTTKKKPKGSILVVSGRLKRSVKKLRQTRNSVTIGTDVPYARIHNEGGEITKTVTVEKHSRVRAGRKSTVKSHKRTMNTTIPQRQFIGESAILLRRVERLVEREIRKIIRS